MVRLFRRAAAEHLTLLAPRSTPRAFRAFCEGQGLVRKLRVLSLSSCALSVAKRTGDDACAERRTHTTLAEVLTDGSLRYVARLAFRAASRPHRAQRAPLPRPERVQARDRRWRLLRRKRSALPPSRRALTPHRAQGAFACSSYGCRGARRSPTSAASIWQVPSFSPLSHVLHSPHTTLPFHPRSAPQPEDSGLVRNERHRRGHLPALWCARVTHPPPYRSFRLLPAPVLTARAGTTHRNAARSNRPVAHGGDRRGRRLPPADAPRAGGARNTRDQQGGQDARPYGASCCAHPPADRFSLRLFDGSLTEVTPLRVDRAVRTLCSERQVLGVAREGALRFSIVRRYSTPFAARLLAPSPLDRQAQRHIRSFLVAHCLSEREDDGSDSSDCGGNCRCREKESKEITPLSTVHHDACTDAF